MLSTVQSKGESSLNYKSSPTVWLFQIITNVWIGRDENQQDIWMPAAVDMFYSADTGGRNAVYTWEEWETTKKELRVRGYDFQGQVYSRATREGKDIEKHLQEYMDYVASATAYYNAHSNDSQHTTGEIQYIPVLHTPAWMYLSLVVSIIFMMFVLLQFANR